MVSLPDLQAAFEASSSQPVEYQCQAHLNLYDGPESDRLATQAAKGRHLQILSIPATSSNGATAIPVRLCEDDYLGWLRVEDVAELAIATTAYQAIALSAAEIQTRLPEAIAFTYAAMQQANYYLWGGTVGPNYDCSGLMQAAFTSVGIQLPRDAYQQEAFIQPVAIEELQPGDLIFFGSPAKATHVGLYVGDHSYIHSSGKEQGRNGIGIDRLSEQGDIVSQTYYRQLRGAGRVMASYQPQS
ncbi:C40 family peptidase [Trichocoleus sp. FACHB-591]|uniref:C40 family peptidase n=1 Tax=Trichocoleus sp. FACHB-591 TaxID=2692872 RepID=UPI0016843918|nr:C40 family peptidase [Trichocoleus sp. FACHB-591]MBD2095285.1 C40 family peptidase [Trichocoleus sp. FACHB-591]